MSAAKKAIKEILRAKRLYLTPAVGNVKSIGIRSYTAAKKPSSKLMHESGILDAAGLNVAKDFIKKKLAQTDTAFKGLAHLGSGNASSGAALRDSLKKLRKAKTSDLASKYKYKNINLKNKIMAKSLFAVPAALVLDRMYGDGPGTAKDED